MKAIVVGPKGLRVDEIPEPPVPRGKVRVKVRYAGVGFADVMAVRGGYPLAPRMPYSPGYEFYGEADGRPVAGMVPVMGAYREFLDVDPRYLVPVPGNLSPETAALVPLNYLTALAMVDRIAGLKTGQSLLVHGAAGGVGSAVLELARNRSIRAYGTASSAKHGLVDRLGGIPLVRGTPPAEKVDAVFDAFGVKSFRKSWEFLAPRGTLVAYGMSPDPRGGSESALSVALFLGEKTVFGGGRRLRICSAPNLVRSDPDWYRESLGRLLVLADEGQLNPVLGGVLPWDQVAEAHRRVTEGSVSGKLLLDFS